MNKPLFSLAIIGVVFIVNIFCRENACYFPKSKCKKYIIIKNKVLAKILIASGVGLNKVVSYGDRNKMSIVGIFSYIITEPLCILFILLALMEMFKYGNFKNLNAWYECSFNLLESVSILNSIILAINTWKCEEKRLH